MYSIRKGVILATAAAALLVATNGFAADNSPSHEKPVKCNGVNSCRGRSQCGVKGKNACAGQNSCKGQGWLYMKNEQECKSKGGAVEK